MRIIIITGLALNDIGGPFQYAPHLRDEFGILGHEVKVVSFGKIEKVLPIGLRHLFFFVKIFPKILWSNYVLALDTFSSGFPAVMAASLCSKKSMVRVGGDSLWSAYVNRTAVSVSLPNFYKTLPKLNLKEKLIKFFTKMLISKADALAFNTDWQKIIWQINFDISKVKIFVVRNYIPPKNPSLSSIREGQDKRLLWAGRVIPEKNLKMLEKVANRLKTKYPEFGVDIVTNESHQSVLEMIKKSYAVISPAISDICPNFILEAVSFNKPFIMTRETGLGEIYPIGGIFADTTNESELEKAIETILNDKIYVKLSEELKTYRTVHTWREIAKEYIQIWKNL